MSTAEMIDATSQAVAAIEEEYRQLVWRQARDEPVEAAEVRRLLAEAGRSPTVHERNVTKARLRHQAAQALAAIAAEEEAGSPHEAEVRQLRSELEELEGRHRQATAPLRTRLEELADDDTRRRLERGRRRQRAHAALVRQPPVEFTQERGRLLNEIQEAHVQLDAARRELADLQRRVEAVDTLQLQGRIEEHVARGADQPGAPSSQREVLEKLRGELEALRRTGELLRQKEEEIPELRQRLAELEARDEALVATLLDPATCDLE